MTKHQEYDRNKGTQNGRLEHERLGIENAWFDRWNQIARRLNYGYV